MILFSDAFTRANSTTVGNGWTESESDATNFQINNNQLYMQGSSVKASNTRLYRAVTQRKSNIVITCDISWDDANGPDQTIHVVTNNDTNYGKGVGFMIVRDTSTTADIYLTDDSTNKATEANVSWADATLWTFELTVKKNYSLELRHWATSGGSRPDTADLSVASFAPTTDGGNWAIMRNQATNTRNARLDNFLVEKIPVAGGSFLYQFI